MTSRRRPATSTRLTPREARRLALLAQGLLGKQMTGGPSLLLRRLRAVQLDTISVLARSHELVAYARLGAVSRHRIEKAYWAGPPFRSFEYWAHAACVLPMEDWPMYEFRRRERRARGRRWHQLDDMARVAGEVLARLRSDGPLSANGLGGAKRGGPWWDWSDTKIAVEWLLDVGDVVCASRRGFQRIYDLPERAVPADLLALSLPEDEQVRHLLRGAARALGVATAKDLATYCGLTVGAASALLPELDLVPVDVDGWSSPAFADPAMLEIPTTGLRSRPRILSPFDSLVWDRSRTERLFAFRHRLEAYTPKHKRIHGYFSMPLLVGDTLVGRVDPGREDGSFVAKAVHLEAGTTPAVLRGLATALWEAATWVGSHHVRIDHVAPASAREAVLSAIGEEAARRLR